MKITKIDVYQLTYSLVDGKYAWSGGHAVTSLLSSIVRVSTDEGLTGFAEVCPLGATYMEAFGRGVPTGIQEIGPFLVGRDPTQLKAINGIMDSTLSGHNYVKAPLDIACWDLLGKATNVPLCELLGGQYVDSYPLYRAISQQSAHEMAEDVSRYRSEGYGTFQLKVGGQPMEDIARIRACLEVLHGEEILVADANTGWQTHEALRVVNRFASENLYVEQPCPTIEECLVIRQKTALPMVLDEVITGVGPLLKAYHLRGMDIINLKISRVGGLTKAKLIRDLCETLGIAMTIEDSWGGDIATATIAHLVASTKPEFLFTSTDFNSYVDVRVAEDAPLRKGGHLDVPSGPGLGINVDEKRLGDPILTVR